MLGDRESLALFDLAEVSTQAISKLANSYRDHDANCGIFSRKMWLQTTKRAATRLHKCSGDGPSSSFDAILREHSSLGAGVAGSRCDPHSSSALAAQSETLDQGAVTLDVDVLEVAQQASALPDEQKQATT